MTYTDLDNIRLPEEVLKLEEAGKTYKEILRVKSKVATQDAEDFVVLAYLEKTGVYGKLRDILFDVYYGKKFPNPLPRICSKIEDYSYQEQADLLTLDDVEEIIYREDQTVEHAYFGELNIKNYFAACKPPIII